MVATGDLRVNSEKQARVRQAAEAMLEALDVLEDAEPRSAEAVEAKDEIVRATREAMAATGARQPA